MQMLKEHGLDQRGNGRRRQCRWDFAKALGNGPLIAIAAHLDTVFPEGTKIKVKKEGTRLLAPGVGDDTRGLAVLLGIIRALDNAKIQTTSDILFVGDVGEEGPGDLRGMKYLFEKGPYKDKIKMFVSLDGAGDGSEHHHGRAGQQAISRDIQGPRRTQLRVLRPGQSRIRAGQCDEPAVADSRVGESTHDVQCRSHRRRDIGECDPE